MIIEVKKQMGQLPASLFFEKGSRAVLLLHAYTGSYNDVRMLARFLEKNDYTVYAPLFSGHGTKNPEDILESSVAQWEQDATAAVQFLKNKGYQEIAVFGLSMGGIHATNLLTLGEEAIIGGGSFCSPLTRKENTIHKNFMLYAKYVLKEQWNVEIEQRIAGKSVKQLAEIESFVQTISPNLTEITVPVFLAQAGKDEMIAPEGVFETAKQLKQTKVTLQWYPNSGHVITVGNSRKELEKDVLNFMEELPWNEEDK